MNQEAWLAGKSVSNLGGNVEENVPQTKQLLVKSVDRFRLLGNCPPTPPLSHQFALSEK